MRAKLLQYQQKEVVLPGKSIYLFYSFQKAMPQKIRIYQVLPRLFGNPKTTNCPYGSIEENGCGKFAAFTEKALKEIREMGMTHIWYTGVIEHATKTDYTRYGIAKDHSAVVKGKAGSPYAIKDYYDIDPDLATDPTQRIKEFQALITRTHRAKLKAIIDFVPNHVARQYKSDAKPKQVKDFGEEDDTNRSFDPQNNFYYIPGQSFSGLFDLRDDQNTLYTEYPAKATGNDKFDAYPSVNDWYETVKLNYGVDYINGRTPHFDPVPDTWTKMLNILLYWAGKRVDGFRCDMAEMVPVEFWGWVIPKVKAKYPNIIFIAEVYNPYEYRNYIFNGKFDYLYDKEGLYNTLRAIMCSHTSVHALSQCWRANEGIEPHMLAFLENHDEQRIASDYFAQEAEAGKAGMLVCATLNQGPLMLYCGQELGERGMDEEGFSGKDGRTTIFDYWNVRSISQWIHNNTFDGQLLSEKQADLRAFYSRLFHIAGEEKAISEGSFFDLMYVNENNPSLNGKQYAYLRKYKNELLLIIANFDREDKPVDIQIPLHAFEFYNIPISLFLQATDLLSGETSEVCLSASTPFHARVKRYSGRIFKMTLPE